jgi:selenocysteine lyase/cysteine desulfurase
MIKALEQLLEWGIDNIYEYINSVNNKIIDSVSSLGIIPIEKQYRAKHYLGLRFPREIPKDFTQYLADNDVHVSVRGKNSVRVTPHVWVDDNDIDKFIDSIKSYLSK